MKPQATIPTWRAWAGLTFSPLAWAAYHQAGSDLDFAKCQWAATPLMVLLGVAALAVIGLGAILSYGAWRAAGGALDRKEALSGRFVAAISLLASGLFALAVGFQVAASAIVPGCFR
ncbi:MAG: hypothetical protein JF588_22415 [Caulobacterales bacterium]|nr:hypothetical protein [Caulobacterales bacterium]